MTPGRVLGTVVIVGGLAWGYLAFRPSDERRIQNQLTGLAELASVDPDETALVRAARAAGLSRFFTPQTTIELGEPFPPITGSDALPGLAVRLRTPPEGVLVEFVDVSIQLAPDAASAEASVLARAWKRDVSELIDERDLTMTFRKVEDEWLIDVVRGVEP
jgi:hypothetical protein